MSGIELARVVVEATYKKKKLPEPRYSEGLSPEYWAGWALAEYQWYSGMRFKDIFERVKLSEIIPMYSVYHEMDISKFIETMDERCSTALSECRLKKLRESRGLSQAELAKISGVGLRSIQMYEQRVNDIDKAPGADDLQTVACDWVLDGGFAGKTDGIRKNENSGGYYGYYCLLN